MKQAPQVKLLIFTANLRMIIMPATSRLRVLKLLAEN
jgi:hypothetical protein